MTIKFGKHNYPNLALNLNDKDENGLLAQYRSVAHIMWDGGPEYIFMKDTTEETINQLLDYANWTMDSGKFGEVTIFSLTPTVGYRVVPLNGKLTVMKPMNETLPNVWKCLTLIAADNGLRIKDPAKIEYERFPNVIAYDHQLDVLTDEEMVQFNTGSDTEQQDLKRNYDLRNCFDFLAQAFDGCWTPFIYESKEVYIPNCSEPSREPDGEVSE